MNLGEIIGEVMTTPIPDLDDIESKAKAATPGPWRALRDGNQYVETSYIPTAKCVGASRVEPLRRPWNPHRFAQFGFEAKEHEVARFTDADADYIASVDPTTVLALVAECRELKRMRTLRHIDQWHEDIGNVLWWKQPADEPPYCGTPLDSDWPGYHAHWSPLPQPEGT